MSYFGETTYDNEGHVISVGDREISTLKEWQRQYIAGLQSAIDCIDEEKAEMSIYVDDSQSILERMTDEIRCEALDNFSGRLESEIVNAVVAFADLNVNMNAPEEEDE